MDPATALVISILILVFALGLPVLRTKFEALNRARRYRRESERFKAEPRVGDRAGYLLLGAQSDYLVGVIVLAGDGDEGVPMVELEIEHITAIGTVRRHSWRAVNTLRYFPPDTPLGIVNVSNDGESVR